MTDKILTGAVVDLRSDTVTQPTPAMRGCHVGGTRWATTCLATTPASTPCRTSLAQHAWALRRRCSCPAARRATCAPSWPTAAGGRVHRRPTGPHLPLRGRWRRRAGQCAAAAPGAGRRRAHGPGRRDRCHQARRLPLCPHPLLCLENTWNGHPMPGTTCRAWRRWRVDKGLALHLDGARLFNAAVAPRRRGESDGMRPGASPACSTACRSASARGWARRWVPPCAAAAN
jgi:hypothetical protein